MSDAKPGRPGSMAEAMLQMYESLRTEDGADEMDFEVNRLPEHRAAGQTVSQEALDELTQAVKTFITARIMYHWQHHEGGTKSVGPAVIRASVKMTVDGVSSRPAPDRRPWYVLDGNRRLDG